jgi:hypothetical protein
MEKLRQKLKCREFIDEHVQISKHQQLHLSLLEEKKTRWNQKSQNLMKKQRKKKDITTV